MSPSPLPKPGFDVLLQGQNNGGSSHLRLQNVPQTEATEEMAPLHDPFNWNSLAERAHSRPLGWSERGKGVPLWQDGTSYLWKLQWVYYMLKNKKTQNYPQWRNGWKRWRNLGRWLNQFIFKSERKSVFRVDWKLYEILYEIPILYENRIIEKMSSFWQS